jgi:SNF family Na+-dependent transporter
MEFYNKIMLYFWLSMFVLITGVVTFMGVQYGFERWYFYYVFALLALLMFVVRRWMMRRMKKHLEFLEEQKKQHGGH